jgi:hypothetical protein
MVRSNMYDDQNWRWLFGLVVLDAGGSWTMDFFILLYDSILSK